MNPYAYSSTSPKSNLTSTQDNFYQQNIVRRDPSPVAVDNSMSSSNQGSNYQAITQKYTKSQDGSYKVQEINERNNINGTII